MADPEESQNHRGAGSAPQNETTRLQQEPSLNQPLIEEGSEPDRETQPAQGGNEHGGGATPPQEGCRISFDFTQRGPEYAASVTELGSENEMPRYVGESSQWKRKQDKEPERIRLVWGTTIIDEAMGLTTPVENSFPLASMVGHSVRNVRDDFRTDWVLPPDASGAPQTTKASPPWIPDPLDDSPDFLWSPGGQAKPTKRTKHKDARKRGAKEAQPKTAQPKTTPQGRQRKRTGRPTVNLDPQPGPEGLFKLSAELRFKIYRELLVADTPIIVYGGWRLVYRHRATRQKQGERADQHGPGLCVAILCAHPLFCAEGLTILYGENTFLYRLRDPTPTMTDVSRLGYLDDDDDDDDDGDDSLGEQVEVVDDDGEESASDWEQDRRAEQGDAGRRRWRRKRGTRMARCDIYVDKHRHLFRSIIVEAEHNRFSRSTMRAMARAILVFGPDTKPTPNIRTLVVRVAPLRDDRGDGGPGLVAGDDKRQQHFTFVDFFAVGSPVLQAIEAVACRFLRIDLMTRYMDGPAERAGCSLTVDRRPEMVARRYFASLSANGNRDIWFTSRAACRERKRRARVVLRALQNLGGTVSDFCHSYVHCAVGEWDAFDDIGDMDDGF